MSEWSRREREEGHTLYIVEDIGGEPVKVMTGQNADETGLVVTVVDNVVTFLSDMSLQEVRNAMTLYWKTLDKPLSFT